MKQTIIVLLLAFGMKAQKFNDQDGSVKHVYASWICSTLIGTTVNHYLDRPTLSTWIGGVSMFGIGCAKEYIWDRKMKKGVFSKDDLISDGWGCALGLVTCRVVIDIKEKNTYVIDDNYFDFDHDYRKKFKKKISFASRFRNLLKH